MHFYVNIVFTYNCFQKPCYLQFTLTQELKQAMQLFINTEIPLLCISTTSKKLILKLSVACSLKNAIIKLRSNH